MSDADDIFLMPAALKARISAREEELWADGYRPESVIHENLFATPSELQTWRSLGIVEVEHVCAFGSHRPTWYRIPGFLEEKSVKHLRMKLNQLAAVEMALRKEPR